MIFNIFKIIIFSFFFSNILFANTKFFEDGLNLFKSKKFNQAKFKFEQDIVLNPKNELSYLYLSKIFKNFEKKDLEEQNLNTVILLNPKSEEGYYYLAKLKLEKSDFSESIKILDRLLAFCNKYCEKSKNLKIEVENSLKQ